MSDMAVSQVWFIDEIIRSILAHLPTNGCRPTLARCARVSRSLSDPALDALWYKMSGLMPLIRLLPRTFAELRNDNGNEATFMLRDAIDGSEWSRLLVYARRVRKFVHCYAEGPEDRLGKQTFTALLDLATLHSTTLFPRLEELSWLQFSHVAQCLPFFSPPLRRITVYVQAEYPARHDMEAALTSRHVVPGGYGELLHTLSVLSPCLEELSLEGIELPDSLAPSVVFSHLRTLHLGSVSTPTSVILSLCSKIPRLASLSLVLRSSYRNGPLPLHRSHDSDGSHSEIACLSSLEVLRVAGAPCDIEDILNAVDSPSFHSITMSVTLPEYDADGWTRCSSILSARFARSLRTVRAQCKRSAALIPPHARSFEEYVGPLLTLRHIADCSISVEDPAGVTMTDADLEDMATSWPYLRTLEVRLRGGAPAVTLPSISSLSVFAKFCPELQSLHLPLMQDIHPSELKGIPACTAVDMHPRWSSPTRLRSLWMVGVRFSMQESTRVASFLRGYFPDVDLRPMVAAGILTL
ncbi:hypothetical protein L226DRAFT_393668 [Lentinus tigrinus ALCF2SS1-7]|uniref:F-box domain-containing protein n=1 Tax=Lentinus tigrinus ALCF2SS1-6 TaxID=1328759 RepID=A0A5C2SER7_9APHY|nr:hypothetical protein L227DRAFT_60385 [Lentinus tigrinus ALCF2SS1-6]RPD75973.1 hypothetical protein L226DRAFT_393668 [Lentinus tigrinus ALCF2SS1-7]